MSKKKSVLRGGIFAVIAVLLFLPVMVIAGSLEPGGAPAPTMKTLDQIPPTWSIKLPASERFVVLADFNNEAVLDKETGLVWETSPDIANKTWSTGWVDCLQKVVGGRKGWHLPTVEQLESLVDMTAINPPKLPSGHPFNNIQSADYWTSTAYPFLNTAMQAVSFYDIYIRGFDINSLHYSWCARGGYSYSPAFY